ncbi:MAG: hypothetical protein ACT4QG_00755 [Sporichthyaceae bacterium]
MNEQTPTGPQTATAWEQPAAGPAYPPPYWPGWYPPVQRTTGQSILVLLLGVASLTVAWGIAGVVALILAPGAKREIAASNGTLGGRGLIRAGVICSWISIALTVLVVALIAVAALGIGLGNPGGTDTVIPAELYRLHTS